jgi:hypothetical protein
VVESCLGTDFDSRNISSMMEYSDHCFVQASGFLIAARTQSTLSIQFNLFMCKT